MNLLLIDTETTGLDPKNCTVIEVGAMLYNVEHKKMLQCFSTLLPCESNPVEHINNIKAELTQCRMGIHSPLMLLKDMAKNADFIMAHNAQFDKRFLKTIPELDEQFWEKYWICTKNDFNWPSRPSRLRLQDICESFGIPYTNAHRALADCLLLAKCLTKVEDLTQRIETYFKII